MKINFDHFEDYTDYIKDNHVEICTAIFRSIERAIKENEDEALLFEIFFGGQDFVYEVTIDRPDWIGSLDRCIDLFTQHNQADLAIDAHQLKTLVEELLELS
jgi:hypothetical protein